MENKKIVKLIIIALALAIFIPLSLAGTIDIGAIFGTNTGTEVLYYVNTTYEFENITLHTTALNINGGNVTGYAATTANITLDTLGSTYFNFSNNATLTNISVSDNFANFSVTNGLNYSLSYINGTSFQEVVASSGKIEYTDIPISSWSITQISIEEAAIEPEQVQFIFI